MLRQLVVENVALIERLDLNFDAGLTVITGETGAGKSILIDSLGLVLGERAAAGLLRAGCDKAMAMGRFRPPPEHPARQWLAERDLDLDPEEDLHLRRVISANGRTRAYINETPAPVSALAELGDLLVDIHGQHDHQSLLHASAHLTILDQFAAHPALTQGVRDLYAAWKEADRALRELQDNAQQAHERRGFLSYQLEELDAAGVRPGEQAELESQRARLSHAEKLARAMENALELLEQGEGAALELTNRAVGELEDASAIDAAIEPIAESVRSLHYELEAASERVRHYRDGLELDPSQLADLEERLDLIIKLARKHRCDSDELEGLAERWRAELDALDNLDGDQSAWEKRRAKCVQEYDAAASKLGASRRKAAAKLVKGVEKQLKELHMGRTRVDVAFEEKGGDPRANGREEAVILVSANPGEPLKPLKEVASGGELARLMLALKTELSDAVSVPTLIFDEVDVGVGGRVASAIGAKLAQAATGRQVLAITHLPQVAAHGQHHMKVEKTAKGQRTRTSVSQLTPAEQIEELARMLAGDTITDKARDNAQELVADARKLRG
ncbi:DNA repair protein RecN [Magnetofaba australis]|uniref:DNA repair protein RecN n=1 Tax=Magnetofaba australis IT-1 TaxID=1434232 RepID=A0A1Y2K691_9PROT|nr:DNA repair protein RecN [Magnetofaba australis]OSM04807.1 putative DNA repair protein RecN [Magnetofaba australis IT-1]